MTIMSRTLHETDWKQSHQESLTDEGLVEKYNSWKKYIKQHLVSIKGCKARSSHPTQVRKHVRSG